VKKLQEKENYKSIEAYISYHPSRSSETGEHLKLFTNKGNINFNSHDYKDFNQILDLIFQERVDLKFEFKNKIKKQRKTHIDETWIYYSVSLLILIAIYLKNRYW
jgi:hypothetical protein